MAENNNVKAGFGILVIREGKALFGRRHADSAKADSELHGEGTWTLPGGKLHFGESFEHGGARELLEETGLQASDKDMKVFSLSNDMVSDAHFVTIGMLCISAKGEPQVMEPDEITEWNWFDLNALPKPLFFPSEKMIKNYLDKTFYKY